MAKETGADVIAPPTPPLAYFGIARSLMSGINLLAQNPAACGLALPMLCAHALECLLKAYLSRSGEDRELRTKDVRHNISRLWAMAFSEGLEVSEKAPAWVDRLSEVHDAPYCLRYSTNVHGIVTPGVEPMVTELNALLVAVKKRL